MFSTENAYFFLEHTKNLLIGTARENNHWTGN